MVGGSRHYHDSHGNRCGGKHRTIRMVKGMNMSNTQTKIASEIIAGLNERTDILHNDNGEEDTDINDIVFSVICDVLSKYDLEIEISSTLKKMLDKVSGVL